MKPIIAYFRVSTQRQGKSGLGLDAQRQSLQDFARTHRADIVAEFTEVETGKRSDRPELAKAIRRAKQLNARLVVAKLDRLARNMLFIAQLMESGVEFAACDMPEANRLTLHIMAAFAEHEARAISERTKAALARCRKPLGTHRPGHKIDHRKGSRIGLPKIAAQRAKAHAEAYQPILPILQEMADISTLQEIADRLNNEGHATVKGKAFKPMTVKRLLADLYSVA